MSSSSEDEKYSFNYSDDDEAMFDGSSSDGDSASDSSDSASPASNMPQAKATALSTSQAQENRYYESKEDGDMAGFASLVERDATAGEHSLWAFKALKQVVKLHLRAGDHAAALASWSRLLSYVGSTEKNGVSAAKSDKTINSVLDLVSRTGPAELEQHVYRICGVKVRRAFLADLLL